MDTIMAVHEVKDPGRWLNAWKPGPGSRHDTFKEHGAPKVRVFQDEKNPRFTGLLIDVENMPAFLSFLSSPEGAAAKEEDGVISESLKILGEVSG